MHAMGAGKRRGERGAAMIVVMVTLVALLGISAITILSIRSDTISAGQGRFDQAALYAAESGAYASVEYLRTRCVKPPTGFGAFVSASNSSPQSPADIPGNGKRPGVTGNPFDQASQQWYEITLYNNIDDSGFVAGNDADQTLVVRATGHGPNQSTAIIEVTVFDPGCGALTCLQDSAQRSMSALNDANTVCGSQVSAVGVGGGARTFNP